MPASATDRFGRDRRGASAVEFALLFPVLALLVFGAINIGMVLATIHGLQQLAGEAARASVAGLTDDERATLARSYVSSNASAYGMIDRSRLSVFGRSSLEDANAFEVVVTYDTAGQFGYMYSSYLQGSASSLQRRAVVVRGSY